MRYALLVLGFALAITAIVSAQQTPTPTFRADVDIATNDAREGRLYVIALDEVDPDLALKARHYLRRFIERHFEPDDIGAVINVGRASRSDAQDFTSDRGLLVAAIDRLKGWPLNEGRPSQATRHQVSADPPSLRRRAQAAALKALIASLPAATFRYASVDVTTAPWCGW